VRRPDEWRPGMGSAEIQQNLNRLFQTIQAALFLLIVSL
jgi:hypothetical protein